MSTTSSPSPRIAARRADRRDEILDVAWELAREDGLAGLSLRSLARHVGMQAPSLYGYFASKDAIYDGMYVRGYQDFRRALDRADPTETTALEALTSAARQFVAFANDDPVRFQLLFQLAVPGWHPSQDAYAVAVEVFDEMVEDLAAFGITDRAAVDQWSAIVTGLASQQVANDPGGDRWLRTVGDVAAMFLAHHRPDLLD